jgi:hypothetical protein
MKRRWAVVVVNGKDEVELMHRGLSERDAREVASELRVQSTHWPRSWRVLVVPQ